MTYILLQFAVLVFAAVIAAAFGQYLYTTPYAYTGYTYPTVYRSAYAPVYNTYGYGYTYPYASNYLYYYKK
jgi:hypothetical protein